MPKEPEIQPGQAFHLPAAQQKNLTTLLGVLNKKEATEAITAIGKMDRGMWSDARITIEGIKSIVEAGGLGAITESFMETIKLQIEDMLSPLTNEINQLIGEVMAPIKVLLNDIINNLSQFIASNSEGGAIGGIAGQILGMFLPGGKLLVIIGALIGAAIQQLIEWLIANIKPTGEILEEAFTTVLDLIQSGDVPPITTGTFGQIMPSIILQMIKDLREQAEEDEYT